MRATLAASLILSLINNLLAYLRLSKIKCALKNAVFALCYLVATNYILAELYKGWPRGHNLVNLIISVCLTGGIY